MAGRLTYPGSPHRCPRCKRRLSRRSAEGFDSCPWCSPEAQADAEGVR